MSIDNASVATASSETTSGNAITLRHTDLDPHRRRNAYASVAVLGAAVFGLILAAPNDPGHVQAITVAPGPGLGTSAQHGSGCTYKVTIAADPGGGLVHFEDSAPATFSRLSPVPADRTIEILWTPLGPGPHLINVLQADQATSQSEAIEVAVGHDLGSSCVAMPF
ncbi:hypothetical protein [Nocardia sp. 348MFTsu5.1]|uniref:hypothetical protein n=1 Tax=Nocardia sp. 348MFTsu5.1 TaxID=1172185 RepID=UPI00037E5D48|nr:hypothetical protein [Nocardia sp. 348MFTsu5.1]